ncbi:MAG: hypothetical protein GY810_06060 [Aureispira sp.]|nr:hypothetical protein [Aureispira sp.]
MVSQIRQPIEVFFNWLEQKVHIQVASKLRLSCALLKVFLNTFLVTIGGTMAMKQYGESYP